MKNILVPIDFSESSRNAAKAAIFMAQKAAATIHLIHIVKAPSDWSALSVAAQQRYPDIETSIVDAEIRLARYASDEQFRDYEVNTHVEGGVPYEAIVHFAKSKGIKLIVMGAHGAGETDSLFIGSTAQRVMRLAECPVLSVKRNTELNNVTRILFPSDFDEDISRAIDIVSDLAELLSAEVDLLYVNTPAHFTDTETAEERMDNFVPLQDRIRFHTSIVNDYDMERGVLRFIKERKPQLLAMVTHRRDSKPAYMISATDTLLFRSDVPVLSMVMPKKNTKDTLYEKDTRTV